MSIKKPKKRIRKKPDSSSESFEGLDVRLTELQQQLAMAHQRTAEALQARDHSEAKLAELEDILEFTTERADSAEIFANEVADTASIAQTLSMQCHDLESELDKARQDAEAARRILREYESLAEDAEERAYQAEHDLWLAEQRINEAGVLRAQPSADGPLTNVVEGLVERQMLAITLDLAVKQGGRHKRKVALLSVGHIGSWDVKTMQPVLAKRLAKIVRDSDMLGRLDDETFGILVSEQTDLEEIRFIAHCIGRRAESVFAGPVVIKGTPHYLKVAIGVSIFPDDAPTASLVLAHSETALSEARIVSQVGLNFYSERL
jgi:hypothetical protein